MFLEKPAKCHFKEDCLPLPNLQIFFYKLLDLFGSRAYIAARIEVVHWERWKVWEIFENDRVKQVQITLHSSLQGQMGHMASLLGCSIWSYTAGFE